MEELQTNKESQSSVEYSTTSKGVWSFNVKVYNKEPLEAFKQATEISQKAEQVCNAKNIGKGG